MKTIERANSLVQYNGECIKPMCANCPWLEPCLSACVTTGKGMTREERLRAALDYIAEEILVHGNITEEFRD